MRAILFSALLAGGILLTGEAYAQEAQAPATAQEPSAQPAPATETAPPARQGPAPTAAGEPSAPPVSATDPVPVQDLPIEGLQQPSATSGASPAADAGAPVAQAEPNATLPHDLSPWAMFMAADMVVKSVMIGLAIASVITWTVWLVKTLELWAARARVTRGLRAISQDTSLAAAAQTLGNKGGVLRSLIEVAAIELRMSTDTPDKSGIKERVASRLERVEAAAVRNMNKGTGVLATIGSTAPFVGLFGTVWGIMNSFIGISKSQTTNLAVVAPGIAEALLATAIGLVAAIPAVIIYNWFSRGIGVYKALVGDASAEVMRLVSRDLDRVSHHHRHARAAE